VAAQADFAVRVFVAGGSGAIGRRLLPQLVTAGHEVAATTRSPDKTSMLQALGAQPVVLDAFDAAALARAVRAFRPDAVMNQLTDLPKRYKPRKLGPYYERTARLRVDVTRTLLDAGAGRFIYQSIAFMYSGKAPAVVAEDAPLALGAPEPFGTAVRSTAEGERLALEVGGIVLRCGQLYGPGTYFDYSGDFARQARGRMLPIVGSGHGIFSFVHVDDAAAAAICALERGSGIFNIVDDEPAEARTWIPAFCTAVGAPAPIRVPGWLAALLAGGFAAATLQEACGASNVRARSELGWTPSRPTWRTGFRQLGDGLGRKPQRAF
jgi:nucleoside-diphosphate-sugar epimerase